MTHEPFHGPAPVDDLDILNAKIKRTWPDYWQEYRELAVKEAACKSLPLETQEAVG